MKNPCLDRAADKIQTAAKSYAANINGRQLNVIYTITLLPDGKSDSSAEVEYGHARHLYKNGKRQYGSAIRDAELLGAMEKLLPKEAKNQIEELNAGASR